ncbi:molecular chaperone DnaJ [Candidatus Micrarchaeota archaeon]|nr:molecular chaperone DnaJ [Candidatus Micrarchaeota archaeon]MBU1166548.1 molecular chaperone DnaJ [Candidatus Micrarchaeota archaeon]MBU1887560.1 molecular chaperone DnaJ [Candidatus Micrarchaeota archaeon]
MVAKSDYYEILGLSKGAGSADIKKAYRKLAMQYHPDRNSDSSATEKFKEISEAYAVLSDEKKKAQYDQYGHAGFDQMYTREDIFRNANFRDFEDIFGNMSGTPFEGMFGQMFRGSHARGRRAEYGEDIELEMNIELEDAAKGVKKDISYNRHIACNKCSGTGAEPGSKKTRCGNCNGQGQVQQAKRLGPMSFYTVTACNRCHGEGVQFEKLCNLCRGSKRTATKEKVSVDIPAGIQDGMIVRYSGLGQYGKDGNGELFIRVHINHHKLFKRVKDDIVIEVPITYSTAVLGGKVRVPTLFGKVDMDVSPGTESHTLIRLRNEGIPHLQGNGKGDEMVRVIVNVPKKTSKKERELLKELEKEQGKKKGILDELF